jgi:hypothetical protein
LEENREYIRQQLQHVVQINERKGKKKGLEKVEDRNVEVVINIVPLNVTEDELNNLPGSSRNVKGNEGNEIKSTPLKPKFKFTLV